MDDPFERAAARMEAAADKMAQAARDMDFTFSNHQRFMNDWLERLQNVLEAIMPQEGTIFDVNVVPREEDQEEPNVVPTPPEHIAWTDAEPA